MHYEDGGGSCAEVVCVERTDMDGDILYPDGTRLVIEGADTTLAKWEGLAWNSESTTINMTFGENAKRTNFIIASSGAAMFTIYADGTYSINPNLTAEQYKQALGMVIDYFTKGK